MKINLMENFFFKVRPKMNCMIEMLKRRSGEKFCDKRHLDELTNEVYNNCFQGNIYENRNEENFSKKIS